MRGLIDRIMGVEQRSVEATRKRYAEILWEGKEDKAAEVEVPGLLKTLGKSASDLKADYELVAKMRDLHARVQNGSGLAEDIQAAAKRKREFGDETRQIIAQRDAEFAQVTQLESHLLNRSTRGQQATHEIADLLSARPDLFDSIPSVVWT